MDFASIIDRVAQNVQQPQFQQQLAYISAIRNGQDPQEAMLNQARLDAANAQSREVERQAKIQAQIPMLERALRDMPPDQAYDMLTGTLQFRPEEAMQLIERQRKIEKAGQPNVQYMTDPQGNVIAVDKGTGEANYVDVGGASGGGEVLDSLPELTNADAINIPSGLSPAGRAQFEEATIKKRFKDEEKTQERESAKKEKEVFQKDVVRLVDDLLADKDAVRSVVGAVDARTPTLTDSSLRAENKIRQLRSVLASVNLDRIKGAMSDKDIQFLYDIAAGGLDQRRDEEGFINELERIKKQLGGNIKSTLPSALSDQGITQEEYDQYIRERGL